MKMKDEIKQRIEQMPDEELIHILDNLKDDFTQDALEIIGLEVENRGGLSDLRNNIESDQQSDEAIKAVTEDVEVTDENIQQPKEEIQVVTENLEAADEDDQQSKETIEAVNRGLETAVDSYFDESDQQPEETIKAATEDVEVADEHDLQPKVAIEVVNTGLESAMDSYFDENYQQPEEAIRAVTEDFKATGTEAVGRTRIFTRKLKEEGILDEWGMVVDSAAGNVRIVLDDIQRRLKESRIPMGCSWRIEEVKSKHLIGRVRRNMLFVTIEQFSDYHMYIGIRDYGAHLDCCRFLTLEPGKVKKWISKKDNW